MFKKQVVSAAVFTSVLLASTASYAGAFSQIVVIGDSFSDAGNAQTLFTGAATSPPYYQGRFSNGPNYVDSLASFLGLSVKASTQGGTNYGYASSTTSLTQPSPVRPRVVPTLQQQLATYLASVSNKADPNAMYVVEGGTNDVFGGLIDAGNNARAANPNATTGGIAATASLAAVAGAGAANIAGIEAQLVGAGATNLLTVNLPDLAFQPVVTKKLLTGGLTDEPALASQAAAAFNADVLADLGATPAGVRRSYLDLFKVTDAIVANPGAYGFTNTTDACYDGNGLSKQATLCPAPDSFNNHVFFDIVHYSARTNDIFAQSAEATVVPEPASLIALVGIGATLLARRRQRAA